MTGKHSSLLFLRPPHKHTPSSRVPRDPFLQWRLLLCPCFALQVPHWQAWLLRMAVELRTRVARQPYGDQALFARKSTLQELNVSSKVGPALVPCDAGSCPEFWINQLTSQHLSHHGMVCGLSPSLWLLALHAVV